MKCPKCAYLGFETGDRCRNCGYDFSLIATHSGQASFLPLFRLPGGEDEGPLVVLPTSPRPPLAVRKTPSPRPRALSKSRARSRSGSDQPLRFVEEPTSHLAEAGVTDQPGPRAREHSRAETSPAGRRFTAAAIDHAILILIDVLVVYFTFRIADISLAQWRLVPLVPLTAFLALVKMSYFLAFTANGGQTVGKMATGIRVVADTDGAVDTVLAIKRTIAGTASLLALGIGFLPALIGNERRAFHDRVTRTRVISRRLA